jgi:hypothetical protein
MSVDATRSQYKYFHYWVVKTFRSFYLPKCMIRMENQSANLMPRGSRKFPASGARAMLRCGVEEKTRTVFTIDEVKFNQHLDEKLFAPEDLGNAPATKH